MRKKSLPFFLIIIMMLVAITSCSKKSNDLESAYVKAIAETEKYFEEMHKYEHLYYYENKTSKIIYALYSKYYEKAHESDHKLGVLRAQYYDSYDSFVRSLVIDSTGVDFGNLIDSYNGIISYDNNEDGSVRAFEVGLKLRRENYYNTPKEYTENMEAMCNEVYDFLKYSTDKFAIDDNASNELREALISIAMLDGAEAEPYFDFVLTYPAESEDKRYDYIPSAGNVGVNIPRWNSSRTRIVSDFDEDEYPSYLLIYFSSDIPSIYIPLEKDDMDIVVGILSICSEYKDKAYYEF